MKTLKKIAFLFVLIFLYVFVLQNLSRKGKQKFFLSYYI